MPTIYGNTVGEEGCGSKVICYLCQKEENVKYQRENAAKHLKISAEKMKEVSLKKFIDLSVDSTVLENVPKLSSDHNPVFLNFSFTSPIHQDNARAVTTCWSDFRNNLKNSVRLSDFSGIRNPNVLEDKISFLTAAICSAHQQASKPIENKKHSFTPNHIHELIYIKNKAKRLYNRTLNPIHRTSYYKAQANLKKALKKHSQQSWQTRLESLNTTDNSLWQCQKFFRKKRSSIPNLISSSGPACSDDQKANLLAITLKDNFTENERPNGDYPIDNMITNTLENFFSHPPPLPITPTDPYEVLNYSKTLSNNKAPGLFKLKSITLFLNTVFIKNGVTQGSLLGPILFNIYINDIPSHPLTMTNIYADDTSISATYKNHHTITKALNAHLILLEEFFNTWKIKINVDKTVAVLFTRRRKPCTPPTLYSTPLHWSQSTKYLGLVLEKNLTWKQHILHARDKFRNAMRSLYPLICRNSNLNIYNKVLLYTAVLRPILAYGCPVWGYAANSNIKLLDNAQNALIRNITRAYRYNRNRNIYKVLNIPTFKAYIKKLGQKFFENLPNINNVNIQNLENYDPNFYKKRPRRILLDSYNPP
ncbi:RNA-directed DNA polymerase from mobile element jockey [Trichonephila clavipes]|nr:RNA-directed DNA polymerase from mobile element jockey [Trichonephila clavipes]